MNKIPSFTVNHLRLLRGVYVSRKDCVGTSCVTTFDIRMKEPNREPPLDPRAVHCLEHLIATFLRNDPQWKDRVIYWGPMGCMTGNYLLLQGDLQPQDILPLLQRAFLFAANFQGDVPGATPRDCGNYSFMDLPLARHEARRYKEEVLDCITAEQLQYPK